MPQSDTTSKRIDDFVARYSTLRVGISSPLWTAQTSELRAAILAGDASFLHGLSLRLTREPDNPFYLARQTAWRGVGLVQSLTGVSTFLEATKTLPSHETGTRPRCPNSPSKRFGALLAYGQSPGMLEQALALHGVDPRLADVFACWIQEALLRGSDIKNLPGVSAFWNRYRTTSSPLAVLPLTLEPIEQGLLEPCPHRGDTLGNWFTFTKSAYPPMAAPQDLERPRVAREMSLDDSTRADMSAGGADSSLFPNGTFETRVFELEAPFSGDPARLDLTSLGLECLEGTAPAKVTRASQTAGDVFNTLLHLATFGGAYAEAASAAYGRLHAWKALAALVGVPGQTDLGQVAMTAHGCCFAFFDAPTSWFNHVCIDAGLVCLRRDGHSMAVLAATDTD